MANVILWCRDYFQKLVSVVIKAYLYRFCLFGSCWNYFELFSENYLLIHYLAAKNLAQIFQPDYHKSCFKPLDSYKLLNLKSFCWIFNLEILLGTVQGCRWPCYFTWFNQIFINLNLELVSVDFFFKEFHFQIWEIRAFKICLCINLCLLAHEALPWL